jgi:hypothetical protein
MYGDLAVVAAEVAGLGKENAARAGLPEKMLTVAKYRRLGAPALVPGRMDRW